ncbi:class I SAM-dependent methyltransferase [Sphingobacterium sp. Mn56C]|uniref:class I SAM-dependent methyltransferase n=1 Tax=Sphingobacterium sp. Mn56C TaxID=3395261 RepID=UPI003BDBFEE7
MKPLSSVKIFKTNIPNLEIAMQLQDKLAALYPQAVLNFGFQDYDKTLHIGAAAVPTNAIVAQVQSFGFECTVLTDNSGAEPQLSVERMANFWEDSFKQYQTMWGFEPAKAAVLTKNKFLKNNIYNILIPGFGYGRNAKIFIDNGIQVTGIEIAPTAMDLARQQFGETIPIYHGSVTDMPFDTKIYTGIFCYGLLYLLDAAQRKKLLNDCYQQLAPGGIMVFTVISKNSPNYGKGKRITDDTFEIAEGGQLFFYDAEAVEREFKDVNLLEYTEIDEQSNPNPGKPTLKFFLVTCKRPL